MEKRIVLGSGKLYCSVYDGKKIPTDTELEVEGNLLGAVKGGATLTYEPEFYTAEDDLGMVKKKMLTKENVVLKSGIMTWNGETLKKLCSTARVSEQEGKRTVKIGGIGNFDGTSYVLRFLHEDNTEGDVRVTIVGSNETGFEVAFATDAETVINAEFSALPCDNEGTLIIYEESTPQTV